MFIEFNVLVFLPIHVTNLESPYGVAAHISRDEYLENNTILDRIKDAGIQWIRTDFDWYRYIYNIDGFEFVMGPVRNHSLNVLPIITYENRPPINYLEEAIDRTRMIVSRYQSELKYWEILNEPNIAGFWGGTPDPAGYALLLKESYKAIKEINSSLQVVFGGLAGAPIIFFNETLNEFKDGNLPFDIINIHPYRAGLHNFTMVEYFKKDIESFVNLAKEKSKEKRDFPIWITEMGYSTHYKGFDYPRWLFKTIFSMLPKTTNYKKIKRIGYLHGINFTGGSSLCVTPLRSILSEALNGTEFSDFEIKNIDFDYYFIQNHTLEEDFDMVIVPPSEYYTQIAFNATYSFVKNGGKLVFLQGVPLYYNVETEARRKLKINFISSWGYPTIVPPQGILEYSSEVPNELRTFNLSTKVGTRFFNDTLLDKPNDRMIPILYGINETMHFKEPAVLIYDYDSDLKGSVIISSLTFTTNNGNKVGTEREQGIYVPQNYLLASRFGVEKFFNYEFRATETDEDDPESFFGIVHRNLDPKPAYYGLKALTRAKPSGSIDYKNIDYMEEEHLKLIWKRPDGKNGFAFWIPNDDVYKRNIKIVGEVSECFGHFGNDLPIMKSGDEINLSQEIIYIIGPEEVIVTKEHVEPEKETETETIESIETDEETETITKESVETDSEDNNNNGKLSDGALAGIIVACVLFVIVVVVVVIIIIRKKSYKNVEVDVSI